MTRRFPYALTAVLVLSGVCLVWWTARAAADDAPTDEEIRTVAEAIHKDRLATNERIDELKALRKALADANADPKRLAEVDRLIAEERDSLAERERRLRRLALEEGHREDRLDGIREELDDELEDIAGAIGSLNQSYSIPPVVGRSSFTGGSRFVDLDDEPEEERDRAENNAERIRLLRARIDRLEREIEAIEADDGAN